MGYDKVKIKQISGLMVLAAGLILALIYSEQIFKAIGLGYTIVSPFVVGGIIAFILNLPMNLFETKLFAGWKGKVADKLKRPISMVLALVAVILIINLVLLTVIPQLSKTIVVLGNKIPAFTEDAIDWLEKVSEEYPQIEEEVKKLEEIEFNWEQISDTIINFLKNGISSVVTSTFSVASSIIGAVVNFVVSLIFALYILSQKEKLANQGRRILTAYLPKHVCRKVQHILSLLYRNFSKFITGQCLEAVILGTMFVIVMTIFRMPYAVMVGVLIAFTALIPVVGAFIGCFVGAFLILIENPMQALVFVILFLVLQQLEGNLIYPRVVGNSVGLPSIWVLMAVSVGGSLFGIAGMLTFIPILSTVYTLLRESVNRRNGLKTGREGKAFEFRKNQPVGKGGSGKGHTGEKVPGSGKGLEKEQTPNINSDPGNEHATVSETEQKFTKVERKGPSGKWMVDKTGRTQSAIEVMPEEKKEKKKPKK